MTDSPDDGGETGEGVYDGLKNNSLKTAGYAYLVGDAALVAAGLMKKQYKEAATGAIWGIAGIFPARYGNPSAEKQLELISNRLGHYLRKQGVEIPQNPDTKLLTKEGGIIDHVESFFYQYPSQMLNAIYAIGSSQLILSGVMKKNRGDIAAGALVAAGALGGLLIPEKKPDPEHPPQGAIEKTWAWFQEKPLRWPSVFYWANNVGLIRGAWEDKRSNPANKGYLFKYLTAATYIFGNLMLSMSSKDHAGGDQDSKTEALEKLAEMSARVVAAQPQDVREALVQHISSFLSAQPEVHLKAGEIADLLHKKMHAVSAPLPQGWQQRLDNKTALPLAPSL